MKIKWIGKYDGNNLPTVDVGTGAKELPEVTSKSAIISSKIDLKHDRKRRNYPDELHPSTD